MKSAAARAQPADEVLAAVRSTFSALREVETQIGKLDKKLEAAKGAAEMRRRELGLALVAAHALWPSAKEAQGGARGPGGRTWEQFLEAEGLSKTTAYRYMEAVGGSRVVPVGRPVDKLDRDPTPDNVIQLPRARALLGGFDLRLGRWQEQLVHVGMVDTLVTDPPFGAGTHEGSASTRSDGSDPAGLSPDFKHWRPADVAEFVHAWAPRVRGWMCCMTSHDLIPAYERAYESVDRYAFAPVPCVMRGMTVRLRNDGPSSWTVYLMVSRPRGEPFASWGTLPGAYIGGAGSDASGGRGKPRWLLDEIVRDYSRTGDLVCDPLAGWGSTLLAALAMGRRAIGCEIDPAAHAKATEAATTPISDDNNI